eukprot:gene18-biopygen4
MNFALHPMETYYADWDDNRTISATLDYKVVAHPRRWPQPNRNVLLQIMPPALTADPSPVSPAQVLRCARRTHFISPEDALGLAHRGLDVQRLDVVPVLLEKGHQEIDGHQGVLTELVRVHANVADGDAHAQHLSSQGSGNVSSRSVQRVRQPEHDLGARDNTTPTASFRHLNSKTDNCDKIQGHVDRRSFYPRVLETTFFEVAQFHQDGFPSYSLHRTVARNPSTYDIATLRPDFISILRSACPYLLQLELDVGADVRDLRLHVVRRTHHGGELTGLVEAGAQQTRDLRDERLRGQSEHTRAPAIRSH